MRLRVNDDEKDGFTQAAELAGVSFSSWARERLRSIAAEELTAKGRKVPFLSVKNAKRARVDKPSKG